MEKGGKKGHCLLLSFRGERGRGEGTFLFLQKKGRKGGKVRKGEKDLLSTSRNLREKEKKKKRGKTVFFPVGEGEEIRFLGEQRRCLNERKKRGTVALVCHHDGKRGKEKEKGLEKGLP